MSNYQKPLPDLTAENRPFLGRLPKRATLHAEVPVPAGTSAIRFLRCALTA